MAPPPPIPFLPFYFLRTEPEVWFQHVETIFTLNNIVDDAQKFAYLQANLDAETPIKVLQLFKDLPEENKYVTVKKKIVSEATRELLIELSLDEKKPSMLLREMKQLAEDNVEDNVLRNVFLNLLPKSFQLHLVGNTDDINTLAEKADQMLNYVTSFENVADVQPSLVPVHSNHSFFQLQLRAQLKKTIKELTQQLASLKVEMRLSSTQVDYLNSCLNFNLNQRFSHLCDRNSSSFPKHSPSPLSTTVLDGIQICYYH